jgi:hypothetical protein
MKYAERVKLAEQATSAIEINDVESILLGVAALTTVIRMMAPNDNIDSFMDNSIGSRLKGTYNDQECYIVILRGDAYVVAPGSALGFITWGTILAELEKFMTYDPELFKTPFRKKPTLDKDIGWGDVRTTTAETYKQVIDLQNKKLHFSEHETDFFMFMKNINAPPVGATPGTLHPC